MTSKQNLINMQYGAALTPASDADGDDSPASNALANNDAFASAFTGGLVDPADDDGVVDETAEPATDADSTALSADGGTGTGSTGDATNDAWMARFTGADPDDGDDTATAGGTTGGG